MKYKNTIILLALVVFLLSIAGVSASEIGDTIASENANTIELSTDNDIEDNLQTSEENEALASTDYDEALSAQTDTEVLGADSGTYSDLDAEIRHSGNITLTHKNYTYTGGETITIREDNKVIDGNGAVIDMNGSTIGAFHVSASGVTIKNLTIKNANAGDGGAIYFDKPGTVTNCNFVDNTATRDGGAIRFSGSSTVTNCNFINNKATGTNSWGGAVCFYGAGTVTNCNFTNNTARDGGCGGAVYFTRTGTVTNCNFINNTASGEGGAIRIFSGTVTNCNFINNTASGEGGAVYSWDPGTVTNCNFVDNSASRGGAIFSMQWYAAADTCIFKRNSGDNVNTVIYPPTLNIDDFTTVYGSGEKLTFDLKTNSSIPVTNGNILISVYFKDNGELVRNYNCLSGEGWIPDLPVGSYIAVFNTEYAKFQSFIRTITVKIQTQVVGNAVTATYKVNKYLVITLKDDKGNPISDAKLTVDLGGVKTYTTDKNGQIKIPTKTLAAKTYNAKITFNGGDIYDKSSNVVKVTVKKASNPLKVKAKTVKVKFSKLKKKAQKLKVTKVVKFTKKGQGTLTYKKVKGNKKITINKKTGKVTIKKGLKKGTYKVKLKIKAKGNANYNASAFKTITFKIKIK